MAKKQKSKRREAPGGSSAGAGPAAANGDREFTDRLPDPPRRSPVRLAAAALVLAVWIVFLAILAAPRWRRIGGPDATNAMEAPPQDVK